MGATTQTLLFGCISIHSASFDAETVLPHLLPQTPTVNLASGFSDQLKRRKNTYETELSLALQDGIITKKERDKLEKIAEDMNLSIDQIKLMEKKLKDD